MPYSVFKDAVGHFYTVLRSVAEGQPVKWEVSVEEGSNNIHWFAWSNEDDYNVSKVIDDSYDLVRLLESDYDAKDLIPGVSIDAIRAMRDLSRLFIDQQGGLTVKRNGNTTVVSSRTIASADRLLLPKHKDYGSLSGRVRLVSDGKGQKLCVVDDAGRGTIKCDLSVGDWAEYRKIAVDAFYEKRRVSVYGLIHYLSSGQPSKIDVTSIRVLGKEGFDVFSLRGILNG